MSNIVLPKIERDAVTQNYGRFIVSPLESGYGITLGNALRRVLLASLPGAAVTAIRVSDVYHEFSPIPGVKEDMMALILNVKKLRLKMYAEEPIRVRLEVRGGGNITAGDIDTPSSLEIINPDLHLLTADSDDVDLEIEFQVEKGRGYSPAGERDRLPIGELPVDAIFSPVRKANYVVERTRVGQMTNYDRVIMEIWTDGTIRPLDALREGARILVQHFSLVAGIEEMPLEEEKVVEEGIPARIYDTPIEELDLSVRVYNCLKRTGITKVGEVLDKLEQGEEEMLTIRNFGAKSLVELREKLAAKGFLDTSEKREGGTATEEGAEE
ncbi:MAG: DNA-directed RNA polymerase subunit alpha [Chloroflexota bacterium]|nr:DNA-directed RNA polymerase subunit alpha [Chloroflexota bacterium]